MSALSTTYFAVSMVGRGTRSGYAIKKAADMSMAFLVGYQAAQIYPELGGLERTRLLRRSSCAHGGGRARLMRPPVTGRGGASPLGRDMLAGGVEGR